MAENSKILNENNVVMNKLIYISLLCIVLISCSNTQHDVIDYDFDYIDCSYFNGWDGFNSIKIYNDGKVFVSEETSRPRFDDSYRSIFKDFDTEDLFTIITTTVQTNLPPHDLDTLANLIKMIHSENLDTLYKTDWVDCGYYYLIIHKSSEIIKVSVLDLDNDHKDLVEVRKLIEFLIFFTKREIKECKNIKFESKTRGFSPIPPMPKRKPR